MGAGAGPLSATELTLVNDFLDRPSSSDGCCGTTWTKATHSCSPRPARSRSC